MSEDLVEKVVKLEVTVADHSRQLEKQADKNDSLTRLVTLYETQEKNNVEREKRQDERDKKQQEQLDKFANTIVEVKNTINMVNTNLTNLNENQQTLQSEVVQIGNRVEEIEKKPLKFFWKAAKWVVGVVTFLLTAYLVYKFGWNNNQIYIRSVK